MRCRARCVTLVTAVVACLASGVAAAQDEVLVFSGIVKALKVRGYLGFFYETQTWVKGA
jgi:hypothetical protein